MSVGYDTFACPLLDHLRAVYCRLRCVFRDRSARGAGAPLSASILLATLPTYLGVGPGADWFAGGGHEPMTDEEPDQGPGGSPAVAPGTVVATAPQWAPHPGLQGL